MLRRLRKTTKKTTLDEAKTYVETYSSSNEAARDLEESICYIFLTKA